MPKPITASMLYNLVACPHRVTMDLYSDLAQRDAISPFVRLLWERGAAHEERVVASLAVPFLDLSKYSGDEQERRTTEAMTRGEPLIYGGRIPADDLLGDPDLLRREGSGYVAGDIKSGAAEEGAEDLSTPKVHYAVQIALYTDVLERKGISAGRRPFIWDIRGDEVAYDLDAPMGARNPMTLWDEYQSCLAQARQIINRADFTLPAYSNGVCKNCHWYSACMNQLERADDLTLLPGLPLKPRRIDRPQAVANYRAKISTGDGINWHVARARQRRDTSLTGQRRLPRIAGEVAMLEPAGDYDSLPSFKPLRSHHQYPVSDDDVLLLTDVVRHVRPLGESLTSAKPVRPKRRHRASRSVGRVTLLAALQVLMVEPIEPGKTASEETFATLPPLQEATPPPAIHPARSLSPPIVLDDTAQLAMRRGNETMSLGRVAAARRLFEHAAESDLAGAATALGMTYDPFYLRETGAIGIRADVNAARMWYQRAVEAGDSEAAVMLTRLDGR